MIEMSGWLKVDLMVSIRSNVPTVVCFVVKEGVGKAEADSKR